MALFFLPDQGVQDRVREKLKEQRRPRLQHWRLPPVLVMVKELQQPMGAWLCVTPSLGLSMSRFSCCRWDLRRENADGVVPTVLNSCIKYSFCWKMLITVHVHAGWPSQWWRPGLPAELSALQLPLSAHCRPARQHFTGDESFHLQFLMPLHIFISTRPIALIKKQSHISTVIPRRIYFTVVKQSAR